MTEDTNDYNEMKNFSTTEIRSLFLNFFEKKDHRILSSSGLIPHKDSTLLFTNAGMVQFKDIFTGVEKPDFLRAVTSQKCIRAGGKHNDLENVGYTARHHTFFEMLGNFSFGDYFKKDAIQFAWDFLTQELEISKDKLIVTVYHDDDEAFNLWKDISGLSDSRIIRISTKDNFWEMGESGPCGPCSEIFYDYGERYKGGLPGSPEQDEGERYIEIWNLVFMQYEKLNGKLIPLPKKSVDTGMGLERIAAVCQNKHDNYRTDLFQKIINEIRNLAQIQFSEKLDDENYICARVIADHLRSSAFLISEDVLPGNNGREYVLKRIIRRATIYLYKMKGKQILIHKLVPILLKVMEEQYPQLREKQKLIEMTIKIEEESFFITLERGFKQFDEIVKSLKDSKIISGQNAFRLYDTFGLPLDIMIDIAKSNGLEVDVDGFESEMNKQKELAKLSWKDVKGLDLSNKADLIKIVEQFGNTIFTGYEEFEEQSKLLMLFESNCRRFAIFDKTPFYAESGGQIGDSGVIISLKDGTFIDKVIDVQKYNGLYLHEVKYNSDSRMEIGKHYRLSFDFEKRKKICINHTATHLLHKALKLTLGDSVNQKGSLVRDEKLRFDFNHNKALSQEEILKIENIVNSFVYENVNVQIEVKDKEEALKFGAMALFGEKYGDKVRVVSIVSDSKIHSSIELCGGTHVRGTGEISIFKIISEEIVGSGIRRIEAITSLAAIEFLNKQFLIVKNLQKMLRCKEEEVKDFAETLNNKNIQLKKDLNVANKELILRSVVCNLPKRGFVYFFSKKQDAKILREVAMELTHSNDKVYLLVNFDEGMFAIFLSVSKNLSEKFSASKILSKIAEQMSFKPGGGNEIMASTNVTNLDVEKFKDLLSEELLKIE